MKKCLYIILAIILFAGYFLFLGSYPLLDVDETRYVDMARSMFHSGDFMTLYLNGDYFFEKPPLFFWLECLGFKFFGGVNELTARLPVVLLSLLPLGLLFGLCKKVKNIRFAFIVGAVLLTCLEYVLLTKIAILDSVLTSLCTSAVLCYFYTFFVKESSKKYFWLLTYFFTGLAVMAKGVPGLVIPLFTIAVSTIIFKTYKETFKYSFLGMVLMLLIVLPWHILMLKTYKGLFFDEYIFKHHILRFLGSDIINKNQPWYFYLLTLLWGLVPHIFAVLPKSVQVLAEKFQNKDFKLNLNLSDNYNTFLVLNSVAAIVTLMFFSVSGAKLITYILPIYPFCAVLIGKLWMDYIKKDDVVIKNSLIVLNGIFVAGVIIAPFVTAILPYKIGGGIYHIQTIATLIILPFACLIFKQISENKRFKVFVLQTLFFAMIVGIISPQGYKLDYSFGQNDLMNYAKFAKDNNYTISTYKTGKKYSLLYYSNLSYIDFQAEDNLSWLKRELNKKNNIVIMENKDIQDLPVNIKVKGFKYSLIEEK